MSDTPSWKSNLLRIKQELSPGFIGVIDAAITKIERELAAAQAKLARYEKTKVELQQVYHNEIVRHLREESSAGGDLDCPICGQAAVYIEMLQAVAVREIAERDGHQANYLNELRLRAIAERERDELRGRLLAYQQDFPAVIAECEALRKDAERYRAVKLLSKEQYLAWRGMYGCSDAAIDAARGQGEG